jgi:hypothetical protein
MSGGGIAAAFQRAAARVGAVTGQAGSPAVMDHGQTQPAQCLPVKPEEEQATAATSTAAGGNPEAAHIVTASPTRLDQEQGANGECQRHQPLAVACEHEVRRRVNQQHQQHHQRQQGAGASPASPAGASHASHVASYGGRAQAAAATPAVVTQAPTDHDVPPRLQPCPTHRWDAADHRRRLHKKKQAQQDRAGGARTGGLSQLGIAAFLDKRSA